MQQIITATIVNGLLKPDQPLSFPPHSRVRVAIQTLDTVEDAWQKLQQLLKDAPINSGGEVMTRDQLHERR